MPPQQLNTLAYSHALPGGAQAASWVGEGHAMKMSLFLHSPGWGFQCKT